MAEPSYKKENFSSSEPLRLRATALQLKHHSPWSYKKPQLFWQEVLICAGVTSLFITFRLNFSFTECLRTVVMISLLSLTFLPPLAVAKISARTLPGIGAGFLAVTCWLGVLATWGFLNLSASSSESLSWGDITILSFLGPLSSLGFIATRRQILKHLQVKKIRTIIIGATSAGSQLFELSRKGLLPEVDINGFFDFRSEKRIQLPPGAILVDSLEKLMDYLDRESVQLAIITVPMRQEDRILQLLDLFSDTPVSVAYVPDLFQFELLNCSVGDLGGFPIITLRDTPFHGSRKLIKRVFDFVGALFLILILSPLLVLISLAVRFSSRGSILFTQRRIGLDNQVLKILKFRTMREVRGYEFPRPAEPNDARITRVGKWLRKTSFDELPQLFNVLKGEMSLVGPRPFAEEHNEIYRKVLKGYTLRQKVKPGMTGWAQINGCRGLISSAEALRERVTLDLFYINNWSIWLDLLILLKSVPSFFGFDRNAF